MIDWSHISLEDLAAFLSEELRKRGIDTVLVGGACVTIYSRNRYQSYDLDFATYEETKDIKKAMTELGFDVKGRHYVHDECPWLVEFVSPPIAVGDQPVRNFEEKQLKLGTIRMLRPEDSVKDRLASYFHWSDRQGLEQAVDICLELNVNLKEVEEWAIREDNRSKYEDFLQKLAQAIDS